MLQGKANDFQIHDNCPSLSQYEWLLRSKHGKEPDYTPDYIPEMA